MSTHEYTRDPIFFDVGDSVRLLLWVQLPLPFENSLKTGERPVQDGRPG